MTHSPLPRRSHDSCVGRVPIFRGLTPEQQDVVGSLARPALVPGGSVLHDTGRPLGELFALHTGRIQVSHIAASGRRQLIRSAGPGDVIGEHAFLTGERGDYVAETTEDTRVCVFRHEDLAHLIATYPAIAQEMLRSLSDQLADARRRLALGGTPVTARVADYLLDLPAGAGAHPHRVLLPLAKKDIASWLATTPESLSRALTRLVSEGTIRVDGQVVDLLDLDRLDDLASA